MANSFRQIIESPAQFFQDISNLVPWLSKLWRTLGQVEEWHEVGSGGGEPAFQNNWVNFGSGDDSAAFYKDPFGTVHIKGLVKTGTVNTTIFTLPIGYRPAKILHIGSTANSLYSRTIIRANGQVDHSDGSNVWHSIHCSFRAEQ